MYAIVTFASRGKVVAGQDISVFISFSTSFAAATDISKSFALAIVKSPKKIIDAVSRRPNVFCRSFTLYEAPRDLLLPRVTDIKSKLTVQNIAKCAADRIYLLIDFKKREIFVKYDLDYEGMKEMFDDLNKK